MNGGILARGMPAPDFALPGTDGTPEGHREYRLSDYLGEPVVLVFYPGDDTPVCTRQLIAYTKDFPAFESEGVRMFALSPQDVDSHDRFATGHGGFAFPLLADVDKAVGAAYGVLGPLGFYRRSIVVIDRQGVVSYRHRSLTGLGFQPTEALIDAVRTAERG
jgi:thioredoxin-dependent peroxiredoxin